MTVENILKTRGIEEIMHFTTHSGLLGILHSGHVMSRARLPDETKLEHIYKPNAVLRKDTAWLDYVNLSISSINHRFFDSSCNWHREIDLWWCILGFDPMILAHRGVVFTTTNNMYTGVERAEGSDGLLKLFEPKVKLWDGRYIGRAIDTPLNRTTCTQAEALYPQSLSIKYLRNIYVVNDDDSDEVHAQLGLTGNSSVTVIVKAPIFKAYGRGQV